MKNTYKILLTSALVAVALMGAGCAKQNATQNTVTQKTNEPIKIGFVGPLTGDVGSLGQNIHAGVEVAKNEINASGGVNGRQIEMIYEDGKCDAKEAVTAGTKLMTVDKVSAIIGGMCSGETLAIAPLAEKNQVIMISPASTNPTISQSGDYIFRTIPSDTFQGKYVAEYFINTLGKKKAAILYTQSDWGTGLKDVFEKTYKELGGEVVAEEGMAVESRDLHTQIAKIKVANPEIIYSPSHLENGIAELKQLKELGVNLPVYGGDLWDDPKLPQGAGAGADNARVATARIKEKPQSFVDAMNKITGGAEINNFAPRAYDTLKILADAMNKSAQNGDSLKDELYKVKDYSGIADSYAFDSNGDMANANFVILGYKDGKVVETSR